MSARKSKRKAKSKQGGTARRKTGKYASRKAAPRPSSYLATASDSQKSVSKRVSALENLPQSICDDREGFQNVLAVLRDPTQPKQVRDATLRTLQAATFAAGNFDACRPDYLATLRSMVADPDPDIRKRVLGILAREHDGYTQRKLLDGLKNPDVALVTPEKALQLLGYDIHADAYAVARDIVERPPNQSAKREALRLLAADSGSTPLFEKILRDKNESADFRRLSATALQTLAPQALQGYARDIVMDEDEDDDVKATSLVALTDLGQAENVNDDLYERVDRLKSGSSSGAVKKSAKRFVSKYKR